MKRSFSLLVIAALSIFITNTWASPENIKSSPIFSIIAEKSPEDFSTYTKGMNELIARHENIQTQVAYTDDFLEAEFIRYSVNTTNQAFYDYTKALVTFYQNLFTIDPMLILAFEYPRKFTQEVDVTSEIYSKEKEKILLLKSEVIKSSNNLPLKKLSIEEMQLAEKLTNDILLDLSSQYDKEMVFGTFNAPAYKNIDRKIEAQIVIAFYKKVSEQSVSNAGLILKFMYLGRMFG